MNGSRTHARTHAHRMDHAQSHVFIFLYWRIFPDLAKKHVTDKFTDSRTSFGPSIEYCMLRDLTTKVYAFDDFNISTHLFNNQTADITEAVQDRAKGSTGRCGRASQVCKRDSLWGKRDSCGANLTLCDTIFLFSS